MNKIETGEEQGKGRGTKDRYKKIDAEKKEKTYGEKVRIENEK